MAAEVPPVPRNRAAGKDYFPCDPRYGVDLTASKEEIACLKKKVFLSTNVLDCILQRTAILPDMNAEPVPPLIGSLGTEAFISSMNVTASLARHEVRTTTEWKSNQNQIQRIRGTFRNILKGNHPLDLPHRLIIPIVSPPDRVGHFYVACFDFSVTAPDFFVNIAFYDSLERSQKRIYRTSCAATMVHKVNLFFNNFVLHDQKYKLFRQTDAELLRRIHYRDCPRQLNGYDCGIFAVAVVLHLAERKEVDDTTFCQEHVTRGRAELSKAFSGAGGMTSDVFRKCFPLLCSTSILESTGVEIVTRPCAGGSPAVSREKNNATRPANRKGHGDAMPIPISMAPRMTEALSCAAYNAANGDSDSDVSSVLVTSAKTKKDGGVKEGGKQGRRGDAATTITTTASMKTDDNAHNDDDEYSSKSDDNDNDDFMTADDHDGNDFMSDEDEDDDVLDTESNEEIEDDDALDETESHEEVNGNTHNKDGTTSGKPVEMDNVSALSTDTAFYDIMKERNLEYFCTLDDAKAVVTAYELRTGNRLRVQRSMHDRFCVYECREHVDCRFQIRISRRMSDGMFVVSRMKPNHSDVRRAPLAADGRKWKKRRHHDLDNIVVQVLRTKDGAPTPADVMKTAANHSNLIVPYMTAYRALSRDTLSSKKAAIKNFQLIGPYLEEMKKCNPGSVIGYTRGESLDIVDLHLFPGFMNKVLKFVRPVISLDAAHLRSPYKGMLYIASVLSGASDVYPIGIMIAAGNEDRQTWTKMLRLLKQACPIILEQGFGSIEEGISECPFLFVSDRDKGLKPALREVFPAQCEVSCAKHIEANVTQRYGRKCGRYVMQIAKTYSTRNGNHLLDLVRQSNSSAATYIQDLNNKGILWRNSQWVDGERQLPPRFGIVTSNTSESINSMFAKARDLAWMDAIENIVDVISTRICHCRTKYLKREDSDVVPRVAALLKARWDKTASMSVMELELGCGDFKVTSRHVGGDNEDQENSTRNVGTPPIQTQSVHIVKPALKWCSCGAWQDCLFPCRHACAVYRNWKEADLNFVLSTLVHDYYKFAHVKKMFRNNVFPVSLDRVPYDGVTKPPLLRGRSSGRPRTKRIRRRSEFLSVEDSPIVCSNCGLRGHNRRTCTGARQKSVMIKVGETETAVAGSEVVEGETEEVDGTELQGTATGVAVVVPAEDIIPDANA
jgi:Ulp1 protease family, C-terminal catalytic domain/SWIM zinc finger/Transposase, Mutator family